MLSLLGRKGSNGKAGGGMAAMLKGAGTAIVKCRKDMRVNALLQQWWDCVEEQMRANGKRFTVMDEDTYFDIFIKVYRAMVSEFNEWEAEESVETDWEVDSKGSGELTEASFKSVLFELAETWTPGSNPQKYATFLRDLLNAISWTDAAGTRTFRDDDDIVPGSGQSSAFSGATDLDELFDDGADEGGVPSSTMSVHDAKGHEASQSRPSSASSAKLPTAETEDAAAQREGARHEREAHAATVVQRRARGALAREQCRVRARAQGPSVPTAPPSLALPATWAAAHVQLLHDTRTSFTAPPAGRVGRAGRAGRASAPRDRLADAHAQQGAFAHRASGHGAQKMSLVGSSYTQDPTSVARRTSTSRIDPSASGGVRGEGRAHSPLLDGGAAAGSCFTRRPHARGMPDGLGLRSSRPGMVYHAGPRERAVAVGSAADPALFPPRPRTSEPSRSTEGRLAHSGLAYSVPPTTGAPTIRAHTAEGMARGRMMDDRGHHSPIGGRSGTSGGLDTRPNSPGLIGSDAPLPESGHFALPSFISGSGAGAGASTTTGGGTSLTDPAGGSHEAPVPTEGTRGGSGAGVAAADPAAAHRAPLERVAVEAFPVALPSTMMHSPRERPRVQLTPREHRAIAAEGRASTHATSSPRNRRMRARLLAVATDLAARAHAARLEAAAESAVAGGRTPSARTHVPWGSGIYGDVRRPGTASGRLPSCSHSSVPFATQALLLPPSTPTSNGHDPIRWRTSLESVLRARVPADADAELAPSPRAAVIAAAYPSILYGPTPFIPAGGAHAGGAHALRGPHSGRPRAHSARAARVETDDKFLDEGRRRVVPQRRAADWYPVRGAAMPGGDLSAFRQYIAHGEIAHPADAPRAPTTGSAAWLGSPHRGGKLAEEEDGPTTTPLGPADASTGVSARLVIDLQPHGRRVLIEPAPVDDLYTVPTPVASIVQPATALDLWSRG